MKRIVATLDVGNSSCKLRRWRIDEGELSCIERTHFASDAHLVSALERALPAHSADRVALSCVAAPELERELAHSLEHRFGAAAGVALDCGLRNECRAPHTVGRDRLFAARGAFEWIGTSALVIDAGTAVTVDLLLVRAPGERAVFAGGAIAPGPRMLAQALVGGTARLPNIEPRANVPALGRETAEAMASGVVHGFRGAVRELVERIADEAKLTTPSLVITGGASELLREPALFDAARVTWDDELVHLGLLCAAHDVLGESDARTKRYAWRR